MAISFIDPPELRHLGELASLKKAILGHFDADSSLRFRCDAQRWASIVKHYDPAHRALIAAQLRELLGRPDDAVLVFWNRYSDYFYFESGDQARAYLADKVLLLEGPPDAPP